MRRTVNCGSCGSQHTLEGAVTSDKRGVRRFRYTCPSTKHARSIPIKKEDTGVTKRKTSSRDTTRVSGRVSSMDVKIPMQVVSKPLPAASWDIAEGVLAFFDQHSSQSNALLAEADAAYERALYGESRSDSIEHSFGRAVGEAMVLVMAKRKLSREQWNNLYPGRLERALGHVASGASLAPHVDLVPNPEFDGLFEDNSSNEESDKPQLPAVQGSAPSLADGLGAGSLIGGGLGAAAGGYLGGPKGALIGAQIGGMSGKFIEDYLTDEE